MTVTKQEVDQMAGFMRALNTLPTHDTVLLDAKDAPAATVTSDATPPSEVQAMKSILQRMYGDDTSAKTKRAQLVESVEEITAQMNNDARYDRELRAALMTEKTDNGSRVGDWEIRVRVDGKRKFFNVVQSASNLCIAEDLLLYDAAHGLVRLLNEGGRLNSKEAVSLLRAEQDYAGALNNAIVFKHYLVKHPDDKRAAVFEARYSDAKERALAARDKVNRIAARL
jgi:hypothetical protein